MDFTMLGVGLIVGTLVTHVFHKNDQRKIVEVIYTTMMCIGLFLIVWDQYHLLCK